MLTLSKSLIVVKECPDLQIIMPRGQKLVTLFTIMIMNLGPWINSPFTNQIVNVLQPIGQFVSYLSKYRLIISKKSGDLLKRKQVNGESGEYAIIPQVKRNLVLYYCNFSGSYSIYAKNLTLIDWI